MAMEDILLCCLLMIVAVLVAYLAKKHQFIYLTESAAAMILGILFGGLSKLFFDGGNLTFDNQAFFYWLLPIIIFNAGYSLKRKDFFRNFTTIMLFAVAGTVVSALAYGLLTYFLYLAGVIRHLSKEAPLLDSLMFGALISAIDPVATLSIFQDVHAPTLLYNLVLGESLVNDASAIVLFRTFESFLDIKFTFSTIGVAIVQFCVISVASTALGFVVSLLCALVLKFIDSKSEYAKFELAFILISAYVAYAVGELLSLSGIMSLFFCGICNAHYGYYNSSQASKIGSRYALEALSFLAEIFVFGYLGMQVVLLDHKFDTGLILSAIPLCLISRAINIFPLSWLANKGRRWPITTPMKSMMWLCGLRGAVSYALAVNIPTKNRAIETTTLFIVVVTTLLFGSSTGPMLKLLGLSSPPSSSRMTSLQAHELKYSHEEDDWGPRSVPHAVFRWLDQGYIKPVFGGRMDEALEPWLRERADDAVSEDGLSSDDEFSKSPEVTLMDMPPAIS
ncbi:sodium/hydrogen exchanger 8 [Selaginella moellendorffii]|uniref:sodium/hydrogen exchanger 8 n=1 Tax=Selaginella moellendorffii TaxID=88036 RepID=UPI000D1D0887|nr:sodium/hydrogen exchanger 8 [Selaginella moellendorffii]XP_024532896.1 sodium/hydrogen exchanger 8 [Selaginella moellendorffii]|eukprot:XP_024521974.1 sodium/hydrogen exchanger 8 [Selaginella moellendorffii]